MREDNSPDFGCAPPPFPTQARRGRVSVHPYGRLDDSASLPWSTVEHLLAEVIAHPHLEVWVQRNASAVAAIEREVDRAVAMAYGSAAVVAPAHHFLQRILYRINRLTLFCYDDLRLYQNDRSPLLMMLRSTIETAWQDWERARVEMPALGDVAAALRERAARDLDRGPGGADRFFRDTATLPAYRRLLAIAALDGSVEVRPLSRTTGAATSAIHATLTKLLLEEYGAGKLVRKHSTSFRTMLETLGMSTFPEAYFELVPWEVLATINHSSLLWDQRQMFLRYIGGLLYTEVSVPAAFECYLAAARRLGLPPKAMTYWELHIKQRARHGPWMLNDVAIPLVEQYPADAWEIVLGYEQQRAMGARAGAATAYSAWSAEQQ